MKSHKRFHRAGFATMLLAAGMLGDLTAPTPSGAAALGSEALPIVTVYETVAGTTYTTSFTVVRNGSHCTSSINPTGYQCYSITGPTTGGSISSPNIALAANSRWRVGSVASNNQARVLVKDSDSAPDNMYITGLTMQSNINVTSTTDDVTIPGPCADCQVGHLTLQKFFNLNNGNASGPFFWAVHTGGNFNAPDFSENVVNNRMKVTTSACTNVANCNPDTASDKRSVGTLDTLEISTPTTTGGQGGLTRDTGPTQFNSCNTGGTNKCRQTVKYDYEVTIQGLDVMNLTDSVTGCGGTCNPGLLKKGQLPACGDLDPITGVPLPPLEGEEPSFLFQCLAQLKEQTTKDNKSNLETGGVPAEVCGEACIVMILVGTPKSTAPGQGPFTIEASGDGMDCSKWVRVVNGVEETTDCQIWLDRDGKGAKTFSDLALAPTAGVRTITIKGYPKDACTQNAIRNDLDPNTCTNLIDQLDNITSTSTNCTFLTLYDGSGNSKTKVGVTVTSLQKGACVLDMHVH